MDTVALICGVETAPVYATSWNRTERNCSTSRVRIHSTSAKLLGAINMSEAIVNE